ncbi:5'-3' exoribonuclease 3-like [Telopea speciosissima]|uniref:5'-3' exoribonuclease 3-like n=1 Tax=Telopea speciosissima TaxID=54955 RepID=UPI001CC3CE2C|nr:5'-3' exoribonuclease 3-like [Telopea speciosissima]
MGVPSYYRWLVKKYPKVVENAKEEEEKGEMVDASQPNPNGREFHNLYLDMNGIIHPCFHPYDTLDPPTTFEEVFKSIFDYIDRIFWIVRPRNLLYLAIDGVAPRAKMNQQRSRRFQAAKDAELVEAEEERLRKEFAKEGKKLLSKQESQVSDSNIITPGTEFMCELSKALQNYILSRLNNDPGWKNIKVILSDANVPGEGEHKIMSFIRVQRSLPNYNSNTCHCLYGLDADLIMLALATHEVHFFILREDVLMQEKPPICLDLVRNQHCNAGNNSVKSRGWFCNVNENNGRNTSKARKPYQFLNVWTLREHLELDMKIDDPPTEFDIERIVDDFILICLFVGNDFLPHMPTLEIHEGAIDLLMSVYKQEFKNLGGYLVDMSRVGEKKSQYIKLKRVEKFILSVGAYEERIFKKRSELRERKMRRILYENSQIEAVELDESFGNFVINTRNGFRELEIPKTLLSRNQDMVSTSIGMSSSSEDFHVLENTKELKQTLKDYMRQKSDLFKSSRLDNDKIKLGMVGWKERYYKEKFSADCPADVANIRKAIVMKYTEGLCWVLQYYFSGVPSWTWYYPYHYGPFASDLKGLTQVNIRFQIGFPLKPFEQLMAVLPPGSVHALPKAYWKLMISKESRIIDFYQTDYEVDTDGKRYMWQGIAKLKFIEENRLLLETKQLEKELKDDEANRNSQMIDKLFISSHEMVTQVLSMYHEYKSCKEKINFRKPIDSSSSGGLNGFICPCNEDLAMEGKEGNAVMCVLYECPDYHLHTPRLLSDVKEPEKMITEADITKTELWHEYDGAQPRNRSQIQHRNVTAQNRPIISSSGANLPKVEHKGAGSGWGGGRGIGSHELFNDSQKFGSSSRGLSSMNSGNGFKGSWGRAEVKELGYGHSVGRAKENPQYYNTKYTPPPVQSSTRGSWRAVPSRGGSPESSEPPVATYGRGSSFGRGRGRGRGRVD